MKLFVVMMEIDSIWVSSVFDTKTAADAEEARLRAEYKTDDSFSIDRYETDLNMPLSFMEL